MARVLVVEDDQLLGQAVATALDDASLGPLVARNKTEMYAALEAQDIGLVFMDIMLPGTSGYELLSELKKHETYLKIPVIMLSNLSQMEEINRAMELGAVDYITKSSIDLSKLVELAKQHLGTVEAQ